MIFALMVLGLLFIVIPLVFKTIAFVFKIVFAVTGPLLILVMVVLLILGILF